MHTITKTIDKDKVVKEVVMHRLHDLIKPCLQYMDSHRDRQVVKALLAELTSTKFAAKLQGLYSRQGTATAKRSLKTNLDNFSLIQLTSQIVRNDMTNSRPLTQRILSRRKLNEVRTIAKGRGRKLKADEYPEIAIALEYAFGEIDFQQGGGLEAHPRLISGTLYRGADNATTMKQAREILLSMAPKGFNISLYLSFLEPDTTFKCMNEILQLLIDPALDHYFRDQETGQLKKELVFVVDNGPQERPSSPLVQMCMARLMNFLKLVKITQTSFAEYHSKCNFVERVHAEENRVLSKHGPFSSSSVHINAVTGSK